MGCSSARLFQTSGTFATVGPVSDVQVTLRPGVLDADVACDYLSNSFAGTIRAVLSCELSPKGKTDSQGPTMEFAVTDFRLRFGAAVFWVGGMAGRVRLVGTVTVRRGATVLKSFEASAKGLESAWSGMALDRISAGSRADVFCRKFAKNFAGQL